MLIVFSTLALFSFTFTTKAHAKALGTSLTISTVMVDDLNYNPKQRFFPADGIRFVVYVHNPLNFPDTVTLDLKVVNGLGQTLISNMPSTVTIPSGQTPGYSWPYYHLPWNSAGIDTYTATATDSNGSVSGNAVYVVYPALNLEYFSQIQGQGNSQWNDCGPTSVAMALHYFGRLNGSYAQMIMVVRNAIPGNPTGDTNANQLEPVIRSYMGQNWSTIPVDGNGVDNAVKSMEQAISFGWPIIGFADTSGLPNRGNYTGHWWLITGISPDEQTVYLNDPDPRPSGGVPGHPITLSMSNFKTATQKGESQGQPYGIVVGG